jgi:transcriptional regulator with XRE-family HTH domain
VERELLVSNSPEDNGVEKGRNEAEEDALYVGRAIQVERTKARLTQDDLARLSGVSQPHISSIEKGRWSPKQNTVMLIAEALGLDVNALLPPSRRDEGYKSALRGEDGARADQRGGGRDERSLARKGLRSRAK